jgi:triacylglycerol lipase
MYSLPTDHPNSVHSSRWGDYKGTLIGVSHLDLINWTNRLKWFFWELTGSKRKYEVIIPGLGQVKADAV